jgi:hypothetical protein
MAQPTKLKIAKLPPENKQMPRSLSDKELYDFLTSRISREWGNIEAEWEKLAEETAKVHVSPRTGKPVTPSTLRRVYSELERQFGKNPRSLRPVEELAGRLPRTNVELTPSPVNAQDAQAMLKAVEAIMSLSVGAPDKLKMIREIVCR